MSERAAVPVVWCPECKTGNAPYDDLGCCFKCLCPVEQRYVVTDAEMRDYQESLALWKHWTEHDITEDDDRWAEFTNKVHALLARR